MKALPCPLKRLSLQFEGKKACLWMIVPFMRETVNELRALYEATDAGEDDKRKLITSLTFRSIVRFAVTFNCKAAIVEYVLSSLGRKTIRANCSILVGLQAGQERQHSGLDKVFLPEESQDGNDEQIADEIDVNDQARMCARRSQEEEFEDALADLLVEEVPRLLSDLSNKWTGSKRGNSARFIKQSTGNRCHINMSSWIAVRVAPSDRLNRV
jgi:hypothetical protein